MGLQRVGHDLVNKQQQQLHKHMVAVKFSHKIRISMGFSRQEYWSGLPFPPPGDLPNSGVVPASPVSLALLQFLNPVTPWEALKLEWVSVKEWCPPCSILLLLVGVRPWGPFFYIAWVSWLTLFTEIGLHATACAVTSYHIQHIMDHCPWQDFLIYLSFSFFGHPHNLQDLSSPTRDWTSALGSESMELSHWTTWEFLTFFFFLFFFFTSPCSI